MHRGKSDWKSTFFEERTEVESVDDESGKDSGRDDASLGERRGKKLPPLPLPRREKRTVIVRSDGG